MPHSELILDGKKVNWPSVTEIVGILGKEFLARWRGKIGNEEADRISRTSAALGQETHKLIEELLGDIGKKLDDSRAAQLALNWKQWYLDTDYALVHKEQKVISRKKKFHGTLDAILFDKAKEKLVLVDWKITKNKDHFRYLQLAGYALAFEEEYKDTIDTGLIVMINPETGKITLEEISDLQRYVPLFLALRKLFDFVKSGRIRVNSKRTKKAS